MKKVFTSLSALTLALALCLSLCACKQKQEPVPTEAPTQAPTEVTQEPSEEVTQAATEASTKATKPATKATKAPTKPATKATKATKATQAPTTKATQAPTTKATKATLATKATKATVASTTKATVAPTTKATEAPAANFKTLTYSGTGYQMLTDIYIPEGRYVISGIGSSTDGSAGSFYMKLYNEDDRQMTYWVESVYSDTPTVKQSKSFKGPINGGLLEIEADQNVTWSITISVPGTTNAEPTLPPTQPTSPSENTPTKAGYSQAKGEFTYKYNNFVGTRGDDGTKVLFVPKNTELKAQDNHSAMMLLSGKYDTGIVVEKCDGYGRFDTGEEVLTAGEYVVIVVSKNTNRPNAATVDELKTYLGNYISDADLETLATFIGFSKCAIDTMEFKKGYVHTISNDFGITYF